MQNYRFSRKSLNELETCDDRLQRLFSEVIKYFDCSILEGHRDKIKQRSMLISGKSQLDYPLSKHNSRPSLAVDVAPYPVDWKDTDRFYYFVGFVKGLATQMGIPLRVGADWDDDTQVKDNNFDDLVHFEIAEA